MRNKFVNHARNVWDRAVTLLPRVDQLWYKYTYMEEMLGNVNGARTIFERWMAWEPDDVAWGAYVKVGPIAQSHARSAPHADKEGVPLAHHHPNSLANSRATAAAQFELRRDDAQRARGIMERYIAALPSLRAYLKCALAACSFDRLPSAIMTSPTGQPAKRVCLARGTRAGRSSSSGSLSSRGACTSALLPSSAHGRSSAVVLWFLFLVLFLAPGPAVFGAAVRADHWRFKK